jgi:hypothetical protein
VVFTPVPKERQQAAVKYLNSAVFATPKWAVRPEVIRRVEPVGGLNHILTVQRSVLSSLLSSERLTRLQEQEAIDGEKAYKPVELLADLRAGLFTELGSIAPKVESYRRNLQRAYLDLINDRLNGRPTGAPTGGRVPASRVPTNQNDDTRALFRGELRAIDGQLAAKPAAADRITGLHLREMRDHIARILDPKFALPPAPSSSTAPARSADIEEREHTCWPNLALEFLPQR